MKNILFITIALLFLSACGQSPEENQDQQSKEDTTIVQAESIINKKQEPIITLLRSLNSDEYGGVSHLEDKDFKIIDSEKQFAEYNKTENGDFFQMFFKQISSGNRNIFVKTSYNRYDSGNNVFFQMGSMYLLEYKNDKWINISNLLPEKWTKMDFNFVLNAGSPEISMCKIEYDKKTGEETGREVVETAVWENGKFVVKSLSEITADQNYKVIVAYAVGEVSEDWNYFYSDILQYFKDKGVYVVFSDQKKAVVDNADLSIEIDLTDILAKNGNKDACYLFIENDRESKCVDYDMSDETIKKAKEYFKVK